MVVARAYAKVSPTQFLLLNPQFSLDSRMFLFQTEEPAEFYDLNVICCQSVENCIKNFEDDKLFGEMYALIGQFHNDTTNGYLVVVHSAVDLDKVLGSIDHDSEVLVDEVHRVVSLHLVCLKSKNVKNKINKRFPILEGQTTCKIAQSGLYSMTLYSDPLFFHPQISSKVLLRDVKNDWAKLFQNGSDITAGHSMDRKRSHVCVVPDKLVNHLNTIADRSPGSCPRQVKKMRVVRREVSDIVYPKITEIKKSATVSINLREEAISRLEDAFKDACSPESIEEGYLCVKELCKTDGQLAATAASIFMDSFFRVNDCTELKERVISKVGIDVDQVVLKSQLSFGPKWGAIDRTRAKQYDNDELNISESKTDEYGKSLKLIGFEFDFLRQIYDIVKGTLIGSKNVTTNYSKFQVIQSQLKGSGSSLESAKQRAKYVNICTTDVTSEVLNISFMNKGSKKATVDQVLTASDIVIQFLFRETDYKNAYSLLKYNSSRLSWDKNSFQGEPIHVPGGLLFPILTLFLISYLSDDHITIVAESYGGKLRGIHVQYEFEESMDISIPKAIKELKDAEEKKIAFTIIDVFRSIQERDSASLLSKISLHLGIGCDAMGGKLQNGDPSFLVCSPVTIDAIDKVRNGPTKNIFIEPKRSVICSDKDDLSVPPHEAAPHNSDSDSDFDFNSDSEDEGAKSKRYQKKTKDLSALTREVSSCKKVSTSNSSLEPPILRHRFFAPFKNKHHVVYPLWQGLGSYSISPRTHTKKRGEVLGHVTLDENKSLHRIQSYSPNFRVFHGKNGIAENTFDIRKFATGTDEKDRSLICLSDAARKIDEWLEFAKEKVSVLRKSCGMARLELTFHSKNLDYDIFDTGVDTLIRTFHESTKVYSASLIANLAEISLHSFEGISRGLFYWFGPNSNTSEPISWNVFSEVWNYLSHFARHFFDGRRSYLTDKIYSPRLGYIFSRHFINPSWTGIREAMNLICGGDNLEKLRRAWFSKSKMIDSYDHSIATNLTSSIVNLDNNIGVKVSALLELLNVHSRSDRRHINDAVSCSHCQTICSTINSKKDAWALHPCDWNNLMNSSSSSTKRNIDLRTDEFDQYLKKVTKLLSPSQLESLVSIMGTNQNCFLTGVAGSGKSFLLKVFYPMMIRIYGFAGICITGPTNIAASNVFGQTLHKLLGLIVNRSTDAMIYEQNIEKFERLLKDHVDILNSRNPVVIQNLILCQVLIIDEAGMIDEAVLNFIDKLLREVKGCPEKDFGGVRIILIGDVMQLEPFQPEGYKKFTNLFFQHNTFKNFFVAYLRSNMRQQDDAPFLDALNKIRIGDGSAAIYLSEFVSILNNTSKSTLTLARLKKDQPIYNVDKMKSRIDYYGLQRSRIQLDARYANEEYDEEIKIINNRILNAKDTGYTDLIVCHDNVENKQYTYLKNANQKEEKFQCASVDSFISPYSKQPVLTWLVETKNQIEKKLIPLLVIYKGMSCRVTYQTDNRYVCTNALVVIEDIIVSGGKVTHIDIITCEKNMKARIIPVKISETFTYLSVTYEFSRSQFGVVDSAGLVPWNLQCLTISGNLFYDNSRSSNNKHSTKGILYTIISRVKRKEQLSYLHLITSEEITYGVNTKAKTFDEKYRLQDGVIFDIIF